MSSSDAAGRVSIIAAMRGRHSEMRDFSTVWAITGLHVAPTPPCSMLHRSSSGSAESFHSTVGVVCVIWCSGLFQAAAGMRAIISLQQSAFSIQQSAFSNQHSAFSNQQSAISNQLSVVSCRLKAQRAQVIAAFLRTLLRRAAPGKHILLDHDPPVVAGAGEGLAHRRKIDGAGAKLAKQLRPDGFQIADPVPPSGVGDGAIAILEVHVPHPVRVLVEYA